MIALLWSALVFFGGLGLASRILPSQSSPTLRLAAAWPLGSTAVAWLMLSGLLGGLVLSPVLIWGSSIAVLLLLRPKDFEALMMPLVIVVTMACVVWIAGPVTLSRWSEPWGEGDALTLWQRRALAIDELGHLWRNPSEHALGGYPHAISIMHLVGQKLGGDAGLATAKMFPWWSLFSIVACFGAMWVEGARRLPIALALAGTCLVPAMLHHLSTGYADVPFTAHVTLAVTLLLTTRSSWRLAILLGVVGGAAAMTKREGEALVVAIMAAFAVEPALDPIGGSRLALRRFTTPLLVLGASLAMMAPEILTRWLYHAPWPAGLTTPSLARIPVALAALAADPILVAMAIPLLGVVTVLPTVLLAPRELTRLATGPVRAACIVVVGLALSYLIAILGSPMWVSVQVQTAGDRLLMHLLVPSMAILIAATGPRHDSDPMARWNA